MPFMVLCGIATADAGFIQLTDIFSLRLKYLSFIDSANQFKILKLGSH